MSKLIVPAVYVQHERYLVKRLRFSCHHDALVVKFRLPFMRKGLPQTRLQQVVAWVGKEYLAIKVSEPQIGSLKMGQGMMFVRKDGLPSHVCSRECGVR
jgi:hypothetical protein